MRKRLKGCNPVIKQALTCDFCLPGLSRKNRRVECSHSFLNVCVGGELSLLNGFKQSVTALCDREAGPGSVRSIACNLEAADPSAGPH